MSGRDEELEETASVASVASVPSVGEDGTAETVHERGKRAGAKRTSPPGRKPGTRIGRYLVGERIGHGGMGEVYRARDSELSRDVALKVLPIGGRSASRHGQRLLREAQALAQLNHPNVVAIYDVGTDEGDLFIAEELVDGQTVRKWLKAATRTRAEILSVFVAAGQGLAAIHAAGLVHRDFKPDNVVVGDDGRVRVLDLGLARAVGTTDPLSSTDSEPELESGETSLSTPLTKAGVILGTPAYMAPEQYAGLPTNARSDLFAYSVALFEALYRARPFRGENDDLKAAILAGRIVEPDGASVPRWLRRVLRRGLEPNPEARFDSMTTMLHELARDRMRRWRQAGAASVAIALATVAVVGVTRHKDARLCGGGEHELVGIWDNGARQMMRDAFAQTKLGYAHDASERVVHILDDYATAWVSMRRESCEATHVHGTQSSELLDLRASCLERKKTQLGVVAEVLRGKLSADEVQGAPELALGLAPVAECGATERLLSAAPMPTDPVARKAIEDLRRRIDRVEVLGDAGRIKEAVTLARESEITARSLAYAPVTAEALYQLGRQLEEDGDVEHAEASLREALLTAARAKEDHVVARIYMQLVQTVGFERARYEEGLALGQAAEVANARAGDDQSLATGLLGQLGKLHFAKGDYAEAEKLLKRALEQRTNLDDVQATSVRNNLGNVYFEQARYPEAFAEYERVLASWQKALGESHPQVGLALTNLGNVSGKLGKKQQALEYYQRAIAVKERALGSDNPSLAISLLNMGELVRALGRPADGLAMMERARAIFEKKLGAEHTNVGVAFINIAVALDDLDRPDEALASYKRAQTILERTLGPDHEYVAHALHGIGDLEVENGKPAEAIVVLEHALTIRGKGGDPTDLARTRFSLAKALMKAGRTRARAVELAEQAHAFFVTDTTEYAKDITNVENWQRANGVRH